MNHTKQTKVQMTVKKTSFIIHMLNMTAQLNILQLKLLCSSMYTHYETAHIKETKPFGRKKLQAV